MEDRLSCLYPRNVISDETLARMGWNFLTVLECLGCYENFVLEDGVAVWQIIPDLSLCKNIYHLHITCCTTCMLRVLPGDAQ